VALLADLLAGEGVAARAARRAEERAETAGRGADVGVVDVALDDVAHLPVRVEHATALVGGGTELGERRLLDEARRLFGGDALALRAAGEDGVDARAVRTPLRRRRGEGDLRREQSEGVRLR